MFTYDGGRDATFLDGVSFEIRRVQKVALVEKTAVKQTTLIKVPAGSVSFKERQH